MANYNLYYADITKSPVVVTAGATLGPTHPSTSTPDLANVGSVIIPLLFYGDGYVDYGARIQQNLLNLLENFSAPAAPGTKVPGMLWHDSNLNRLNFWDGTTWNNIPGPLEMATKVNISGSTMTGPLTLFGAPVSNLHAATKLYVDTAVQGSGTNILPSNNTFTGRNWFRGTGTDPFGGTLVHLYAGTEINSTSYVENSAVSTGLFLNGPNNSYAVGVAARAFLVSGTGNSAWGVATEAWTYPNVNGNLIGTETSLISQNANNTSELRGLDVVFKDRPDGAGATTMGIGANSFNLNSRAIVISGQTPSSTGELCGWSNGIFFQSGAISKSTNQSRAHLIDFYQCTQDNASTEPLILTWKDRNSTKRHGIMYNVTNGYLEFVRDVYGTPQRVGFWSFESGARDYDVLNSSLSKVGGDIVSGDISFTSSIPSVFRPGLLWNNVNTGELTTYSGLVKTLDGSVFSQTVDATVAATNVELSITGTGIGAASFPANYFKIGKTIDIDLTGRYSSAAAESITFKIKFVSGAITPVTTLIVSSGALSLGAQTDDYFRVRMTLTFRSTGLTGSLIGQGDVVIGNTVKRLIMTAPVVLDTTVIENLLITGQWSSNNATNSITTTNAKVVIVS
jgi:hypothetical protein